MPQMKRIATPQGEIWVILEVDKIRLFDNTGENFPDFTTEAILNKEHGKYAFVEEEFEKETSNIIQLNFNNIFLANDVYLLERILTNIHSGETRRENQAFLTKTESDEFKTLADGLIMRHFELLLLALIAGDLREGHNYVVSESVDVKFVEATNSVVLKSTGEYFEDVFIDAYQARLILDKLS